MRIAQISPIWKSIPPIGYGGAEKIISLLTEELANKGHSVTLFASGDSQTSAELVSVTEKAPGLDKGAQMSIVNNMNHLFNMFLAIEKEEIFDIIHWHLSKDLIPLMAANITKTPSVVTIHNHFYDDEMREMKSILDFYKDFSNCISISNYHRKYFPFNFLDTVYNGIDLEEFDFNESPDDYMAWVGRFEYQKGVHIAIKTAIDLKIKLKIAAPKDENTFFKEEIQPYLNNEYIEYMGEVDTVKRNELLKNAKIFLNPICWDEPFGLVVPEANACGTPVVAYNRGAMKEIIIENKNGIVVEKDNHDEFKKAVQKIFTFSSEEYRTMRQGCRKHVEDNFTYQIMTNNYENNYKKILN